MNAAERQQRIDQLNSDIKLAEQAIRDIIGGKKQSYAIGTRQAAAYGMSIPELRAWKQELTAERDELSTPATSGLRPALQFKPRY